MRRQNSPSRCRGVVVADTAAAASLREAVVTAVSSRQPTGEESRPHHALEAMHRSCFQKHGNI